MYMKAWNEVVEYVETFTNDIISLIDVDCDDVDEYYELFNMIRQDVSFYTLMILKNFS